MPTTTTIIGAGLAGLAAGHALKTAGETVVLYEKNGRAGGHARSEVIGEVVVDEGPHVSFTTDPRVRAVFEASAGAVEDHRARVMSYYDGHWLDHPAQVNLHGLDPHLVANCIVDFAGAQCSDVSRQNYAEWLEGVYGATFARNFPTRYTRKYWTVEPVKMATDWIGLRMQRPSLEQVVLGALMPGANPDQHYLQEFRYPSSGGFESFVNYFRDSVEIKAGRTVQAIDTRRRRLGFSDGTSAAYEGLISTMPLDQLVPAIAGVPDEVLEASRQLLCTSVLLVDVAVDGDALVNCDWFYIYDEEIRAARVHLPHRFARHNAPPGVAAFQAEIYFSRLRPLPDAEDVLARELVADLRRMGVIGQDAEVRSLSSRKIQYANVVFDIERARALETVLPYVESQGISLAGRYAQWEYHWSDDAVKAGWAAAAQVLGVHSDAIAERAVADAAAWSVARRG